MILDSSAIIALVFKERGFEDILAKLAEAPDVRIGVPTLVETGIVLSARLESDARGLLSRFIEEAGAATIAFDDAHWAVAVDAWRRFGKGRHRAALNFGDCLAYATARVAGQPLLCTGNDFARTDIELA